MDFDAVLEKCGGFHRYQFILLLFYGYTNLLASMHYFSQTIITFTPEHWCYHETLANKSSLELREIYENSERPSCTRFHDIADNDTVTIQSDNCDKWIYNYENGYESISTELNWVCDKAYQSAVGQSLFFIGSVCGTIFFGYLGDRIGRLPTIILSTVIGGLGDFVTSFIYTALGFAAGRFVAGLSIDTAFYMMYIMVFEYISPTRRTFVLNFIQLTFYTAGVFAAPWFAIWLGTWRHYLLLASLPTLGTILYPILLYDSPQWLISKQNFKGAIKCLKHVAKMNRRIVDERVFEELEAHYLAKLKTNVDICECRKPTFLDMFRTPRLRKFTIILLIKSMIITLSLDILGRNMEGLGISPFKLFSYSALTYIPAGLIIILVQRHIGRKGMACSSLFGSSIITAITGSMIAFLDHEQNTILLGTMVSLARFGSIIAYDAEVQYAAEIIPTCVRGQGVANVHVVGYAFNFFSPYIIYLGIFFKPLPSIVISVLMLVGAVMCLALPETMDRFVIELMRKLSETLADGEGFGKDEKWHYFSCFDRKQLDIEDTKL